jgi:hypothetical protein
VVHTEASAYIALADTMANWQHGSARFLSGRDLIGYDFFSISKEGFVPVFVKPASEARLSNSVPMSTQKMSSGYGITWSNIGLLRMICARP